MSLTKRIKIMMQVREQSSLLLRCLYTHWIIAPGDARSLFGFRVYYLSYPTSDKEINNVASESLLTRIGWDNPHPGPQNPTGLAQTKVTAQSDPIITRSK